MINSKETDMRTAIATDSNSGITQEQAEKIRDLRAAYAFYDQWGNVYEGVNLTHEEFFQTDGRRSRYHHFPAITGRSN